MAFSRERIFKGERFQEREFIFPEREGELKRGPSI